MGYYCIVDKSFDLLVECAIRQAGTHLLKGTLMPEHTSTDLVIIDGDKFRSLLTQTRPLEGYDEVSTMLEDIRPAVRLGDNHYYVDLDRIDVQYGNLNDRTIAVEPEPVSLCEHSRMLTLHRFTFGNRFEPYTAEVLAMLPFDLPESIKAFEILNPFEAGGGIDDQRVALNHGFHVAWTILYELA